MRLYKHILTFALFALSCQIGFAQFDIPDIPEQETSVYDYVNLFDSAQKSTLENKLIKYSDSTSTQIVIVTIATTKGEDILYLGAKWLHEWGIGQEKEDNGILILLAKDDRKISINTGYGVEHLLTDAMSKRIIERDIIPYFKQGDYYGGLNRGTDAIFEVMTGEYTATSQSSGTDFPVGFLVIFLLFMMFIIFIIAISIHKRGGGKGGKNEGKDISGSDILEAIILSRAGRGSYRRSSGGFGGFGSSSGGGFSGGFGGGSGGGGGASGSW